MNRDAAAGCRSDFMLETALCYGARGDFPHDRELVGGRVSPGGRTTCCGRCRPARGAA